MAKKKQVGGKRKGAGRKVGEDGHVVVLAVSVPEKLVDDLRTLALKQDWSMSKATTEAIRAFLKRKKGA